MTEYILPQNGLYYRTNDFQSQRQTLVFIHGLTGSSSAWEKYEDKFEKHYNILTFDLRGHGKSKKFSNDKDYKIEEIANDLYKLISHLKIEKFILLSHSFGTIIALEFLRHHADLVNSAIFLNPIYHLQKSKFFLLFISWGLSLAKIFPFNSYGGKHIDYSQFINTGDLDIRRLTEDITNTTARVYFYCLKHIYHYQYYNFWKELTMPVLILHGRKDTISPINNAVEISQLVKKSKLTILDNANHVTVINNFEEVSEAIEQFVSKS